MDIEVIPHGKVTVVRLDGRIVDGWPADELKATLQRLVRERRWNTILDMEGVRWFDSLAIGILVGHYVSVTHRGGGVCLLKADDKVRALMTMTRLADRFGWASSLEEGIAWFERTTENS